MLDAVTPDVVHVCTPHHRHADLATQCLARDVSVLLEKPVAHTLDEGERLAIVAEDSTAVLGVCFQNRYNDTARQLRDVLDEGVLGRILGARASVTWFRDAAYYTRRDWRGRWATAGGGVLMNQAIHTLDLLQWYVGPVTDVRGTVATLGAARRHRGGGHGRPADAAPHRRGRHRRLRLLRDQRPRRERPGHRGDHHGACPPPVGHRADHHPRRRAGRDLPTRPPWRRESGPTGAPHTAC